MPQDQRIKNAIDRMIAQGADDEEIDVVVQSLRKESGAPDFSDVSGGGSSGPASKYGPMPPAKTAAKPRVGAFLAPVASGLTLGASDEILGGLEGLSNIGNPGGFSAGYERGKAQIRQVGDDFKAANPKTSTALELGSSILAPGFGAAGLVARGASTLGKIGRSAVAGGALGGVGGAAYSTEGNRIQGGVIGAAVGAPLGAAIPAAGKVLGGTANSLGFRSQKASDRVSLDKVVEAFQRDAVTPDVVRSSGASALASKTPARLFDMGEQNVLGLTRAAQAVPGRARTELAEVLHGRQSGQADRLFGHVEEASGVKGRDLYEVLGEINKRASDKARPFYDKAHSFGPVDNSEVAESVELLEQLVPGARKAAIRLARAEGIPDDRLFPSIQPESPPPGITTAQSPPLGLREAIGAFGAKSAAAATRTEGTPAQQMARQSLERRTAEASVGRLRGAPRADVPAPEPYQRPSVLYIDYLKRGVDDVLGSGPIEGIGKQTRKAVRDIKNGLLRRVDGTVPEYAEARRLFAGEKAHETAVLRGSRVFGKPKANEPPIDKWLAKATDGEKESFKVGALGRIRDILESTADNRDKVAKLTGTPKARRVLQEIIGDAGKNSELGKILTGESKMVQSKNFILGNSQTARILADMDDLTNTAMSVLMDVGTGNIAGAGRQLMGAGIRGRMKAGGGKIAEGVNRTLMAEPGTPEFDDFMKVLAAASAPKKGSFALPVDKAMNALVRRVGSRP